MKIKEICEKTGLTDRTVRYYIEENLISPFYTENYLGRKAFNFSEEDLERLKEIATLRAYGFSVEEIKDISLGKPESKQIIEQVRHRTEENLDESQRRLRVLSSIDLSDEMEISLLVQKLSNTNPPVDNNDTKRGNSKTLPFRLRFFATLLAVWLPPMTAAVVLLLQFASCDEPIVHPAFFVLTVVCFLPSLLAILILNKLKGSIRVLRYLLMLICVLCIPLSAFFAMNSVTVCEHSYVHYRTSTESTCYSQGERILQCKDCKKFKTQVLEKTAHTPVTEPEIEPTCAEDGLSGRTYCSVCQKTISESTVIPKTRVHLGVVVKGVAATCTTAGRTDRIYCSICDLVLSESTSIPALGHTYIQTHMPATCGTDGYVLHKCACGESYMTDVVRATNLHDFAFVNWNIGYRCRVCDMEVCEYGLADWSAYEGDLIYYYITGSTNSSDESERTLVVYGHGDMPDFSAENPPSWASSPYLRQVTTIMIENGISSLGAYAFSSIPDHPDISYESITCVIVRSARFDVHLYPQAIAGISCKIIYDY